MLKVWIRLWVGICLLTGSLSHVRSGAQPNILFIAVDDLNDWIGCLGGHPQAITPNFDRLARRGILFTNAHCVAPACRPSRTAIFTGKVPQQTGAWSNESRDVIKDQPKGSLMPHFFADHGYATFGTGKLFHGGGTEHFQNGFKTEQRWSPFTNKEASYTPEELPSKGTDQPRHVIQNGPGGHDYTLPLNGLRSERNPQKIAGESFDWGPFDIKDEEMGDTLITHWALEQLKRKLTKPFFMGVGFYRPHIPLFAPRQDSEVYPPVKEIQLPRVLTGDLEDVGESAKRWALEPITAGSHQIVKESGQWPEAVRAYLACVTFVDRQLGRLLHGLERSAHSDNTWIVLWGDHGWHLGEKQHWGKWTGWRESTRVPLMMIPPANHSEAKRGKECAEPVSLLDLYPTLVEMCGLPKNENLDGTSLLPWIQNPELQTGRYVRTMFNPGNVAISERDWRYIRYVDGAEELYHIAEDPYEWHNLADHKKHSSVLERFRNRWTASDLR